jgi:hypothetical protein
MIKSLGYLLVHFAITDVDSLIFNNKYVNHRHNLFRKFSPNYDNVLDDFDNISLCQALGVANVWYTKIQEYEQYKITEYGNGTITELNVYNGIYDNGCHHIIKSINQLYKLSNLNVKRNYLVWTPNLQHMRSNLYHYEVLFIIIYDRFPITIDTINSYESEYIETEQYHGINVEICIPSPYWNCHQIHSIHLRNTLVNYFVETEQVTRAQDVSFDVLFHNDQRYKLEWSDLNSKIITGSDYKNK